ncbi:MAG: hypothetical protein KAT68_19510 [Bacteroidales bacterium]|nr:hypothetical protein [Bacteroidales bacterium]
MNCIIDWCEFYNIILGGLIIGIIASFLFIGITDIISICRFRKRYKHLKSTPQASFDWIAYSMRSDNGRKRKEYPNGSTANIRINKNRIYLTLKENNNRKWHGEIQMESFGFGRVNYKYENEHEYGKKECVISSYKEKGTIFDYIFIIPTNNRIHYIEKMNNKKQTVVYNYGDEILIRERSVPNLS